MPPKHAAEPRDCSSQPGAPQGCGVRVQSMCKTYIDQKMLHANICEAVLQSKATILNCNTACRVHETKSGWTEGRTYRQNFPEGCGSIELNGGVQALDADDELGQLVQLAGRQRTQRTRADGGADDRSVNHSFYIQTREHNVQINCTR